MKASRYRYGLILLVLGFVLALTFFAGDGGILGQGRVEGATGELPFARGGGHLGSANPRVQEVMAIQNRHTSDLMALAEVVGTATGVTDAGEPAVLVFTQKGMAAGVIPEVLEGAPVVVKVTGKIMAISSSQGVGSKSKGGGGGSINTSIDPPPVPIGVSTGNQGQCSAGTIGARLRDASGVYALSCNHVYALDNVAPLGSNILQPGLYDTNCQVTKNNLIGTLYKYAPINFSSGATNTIDAAIAVSTTSELGNATPSSGYGTPSSTTQNASILTSVQKYGRTTSLTKGTVAGINATINVSYSSTQTATFVNQIVVNGTKFIQAGDSGSLLVTNNSYANPVGLLFAGNISGNYAFANPIGSVLSYFNVTVDGK